MESGKSRDKKIADTLQHERNQMFSPGLSNRSRMLAEKRSDAVLVKQNNGKSSNIDFYSVVPRDSGKDASYKRAVSKDRYASPTSESLKERFESFKISQSGLPGQKKNPNPDYVSPYTKEIVQTDIPLKTILSKADKLRNSPRKQLRKVESRSNSKKNPKNQVGHLGDNNKSK
jgi:hypothetical protein